jgi:hypothetical protein
MASPDWGNIPAWLGAGSLLLAFWIFVRDRANNDRAQVDMVGVWWQWEDRAADGLKAAAPQVKLILRNGNDVPVRVARTALRIREHGMGPKDQNIGHVHAATVLWGPVLVAPHATWESEPVPIIELERFGIHGQPDETVTCRILWAIVVDNSGRVWETRHIKGKRAQRVRWWSLRRGDYPYSWLYPKIVMGLSRFSRRLRKLLQEREAKDVPELVIKS